MGGESLADRGLDDQCMYRDNSSQKITDVSLQSHISKTSGQYRNKSSWALQPAIDKIRPNSKPMLGFIAKREREEQMIINHRS